MQSVYAKTTKTDLTASFFKQVKKTHGRVQLQRDYLDSKADALQSRTPSLFNQLSEVDLKVNEIKTKQVRLNKCKYINVSIAFLTVFNFLVNKHTSTFSSKQDEISSLNIQIKDAIQEVQFDTDEISKQARANGVNIKSDYG